MRKRERGALQLWYSQTMIQGQAGVTKTRKQQRKRKYEKQKKKHGGRKSLKTAYQRKHHRCWHNFQEESAGPLDNVVIVIARLASSAESSWIPDAFGATRRTCGEHRYTQVMLRSRRGHHNQGAWHSRNKQANTYACSFPLALFHVVAASAYIAFLSRGAGEAARQSGGAR